jgi:hypothetical protein
MTTTTLLSRPDASSIRCGRNRTGGSLAAYLLVKLDTGNLPDGIVVCAADTDVPTGVTMAAIADEMNGDLCQRGEHPVTASGAITAGAKIAPDAGGKVKAAAAGDTVVGTAKETCTTDGDVIMAELDIPASFW